MHRTTFAVPVLAIGLTTACGGSSSPVTAAPTSQVPSVTATATPTATGGGSVGSEQPVPPEQNPPGDIPDNLAFVSYSNAPGHYRFSHPEGWAEQTQGTGAQFTDKLNGVSAALGPATTAPTESSAREHDVPALRSSQPAFELRSITAVTEPGGAGVRIVYRRNSAPDAVTGRKYRDEVQRYELVSNGREVVLELFGPVGADNVDAYRTMVQSLRRG